MDITQAAIAVSQPNYFIHQVDSSEEAQVYRHNLAKAFEQTFALTDNDSARHSSIGTGDAKAADQSSAKVGDQEFICTYLRIRPLLEDEKKEQGSHEYFTVEDNKFVVTHPVPPAAPNRIYSQAQRELFEPQKFEFKRVFAQETNQQTIFENCVAPLVKGLLADGVTMNPLFLTYGETSSGKSYTVFGNNTQPGVVPRAMSYLFERIQNRLWTSSLFRPTFGSEVVELSRSEMEAEMTAQAELLKSALQLENAVNKQGQLKASGSNSNTANLLSQSTAASSESLDLNAPQTYFQVWMSFLEIYNETIYDLLESQVRPIRHAVRHGQRGTNSDAGSASANFGESVKRTAVELRTDKRGLVFPRNVRYALVTSLNEAERFIDLARANLQISKTALNAASSRSHAVFMVKVVKVPVFGQNNADPNAQSCRCGPPRLASIAFCDLAGSERASKAHSVAARDAVSTRLLETGNINTSLLTLKLCMDALRHNQRVASLGNATGGETQKVVPYRASKLTRLFSNYFSFDRAPEKQNTKSTASNANAQPSKAPSGFNSQMVVLTTIAPAARLFNESVQILDFATIAKEVITSTVKADEPIPVPPPPASEPEVDLRKVKAIAIVPSARSRESIQFEADTPATAAKKHSNVQDQMKRLERVEEDAEDEQGDGDGDVAANDEPAVELKPVKPQATTRQGQAQAGRVFQPVATNAFAFKAPQPLGAGASKRHRAVNSKLPLTAQPHPAATRAVAAENLSADGGMSNDVSALVLPLTEEITRLKNDVNRLRGELSNEKQKNSRLRAEAEQQESRLRQELFTHYNKIIMDQRARYERRIEMLCDRLEEHNEQRIESIQQAYRRREQQEGARAAKRRRTSLESDAD